MSEMIDVYNEIFKPKTMEQEMNYAEGIENCVMKNLKDELIELRADAKVHAEERELNKRIAKNI